jgi:hypothetical protein
MNLSNNNGHGGGSSFGDSRREVLFRGASATAVGIGFTTGNPQEAHAANSRATKNDRLDPVFRNDAPTDRFFLLPLGFRQGKRMSVGYVGDDIYQHFLMER